jgi:hypothetical protein
MGGGLYAASNTRVLMSSGLIENNKALSHVAPSLLFKNGTGGGVHCYGVFEMRGGEIRGNEADYEGDGVWASTTDFSMGNSALVNSNNEVFLPYWSSTAHAVLKISENLTTPSAAARLVLGNYLDCLAKPVITGSFTASDIAKILVTNTDYWLGADGRLNAGSAGGGGSGLPHSGDTYFVKADGKDTGYNGTETEPFKTLAKAAAMAASTAVKKITVIGTLSETSEYTAAGRDAASVFLIKNTGAAQITITGQSAGTLLGYSGRRVLKIEGPAAIRLENITITGGAPSASEQYGGGVYASGNVSLALGTSVDICGNIRGSVYTENSSVTMTGGKIRGDPATGLLIKGGSLNLSGGEISGNNSGVRLINGALTMSGGTVTANDDDGIYLVDGSMTMSNGAVSNNGVGVYFENSTFTMNGGLVTENGTGVKGYKDSAFTLNSGTIEKSTTIGVDLSGVWHYGSPSYYTNPCAFTMHGGVIKENGVGVSISGTGSTFIMDNNNAEISGNTGPGVQTGGSSTFTMKAGKIKNNSNPSTSYSSNFAGVTVGGTFIMEGGEISGNNGNGGSGGVRVVSGSFILKGGLITNNQGLRGGGVYVEGGTTFEMQGGSVTNNTASAGGGVYIRGSTMILTGGTLSGNNAPGISKGVYVGVIRDGYEGVLKIGGAGKIDANNDVFLSADESSFALDRSGRGIRVYCRILR